MLVIFIVFQVFSIEYQRLYERGITHQELMDFMVGKGYTLRANVTSAHDFIYVKNGYLDHVKLFNGLDVGAWEVSINSSILLVLYSCLLALYEIDIKWTSIRRIRNHDGFNWQLVQPSKAGTFQTNQSQQKNMLTNMNSSRNAAVDSSFCVRLHLLCFSVL